MKVCIITTIYKAEKDLPRLLDSMIQQKSPELEFFLIDNGSPDRCGEIAAEYAKRDSRFSIYTIKDNMGYIRARNEGIRVCTGDYIGFCDSDDFLEPGAYDRAIERIHETDCDMYITSYRTLSGKNVIENKLPYKVGLYEGKAIKEEVLPNAFGPCNGRSELHGFMWKEIFRHNLVSDLSFDESLKPYEDQIFNLDVIARCNRLYIDDNPIYNYIVNPESITAKMASSFDFATEYNLVHHLYEEKLKRSTDIIHRQAICTQTLGSFYSMFLYESRALNKSIDDSVRVLDKTIETSFVNDVILHAVATSSRTRIVKVALRFKTYGLLLRLIKIVRNK